MTVVVEAHGFDRDFYAGMFDDQLAFIEGGLRERLVADGPSPLGHHFNGGVTDACWAYHADKMSLALRFLGVGFDCSAAMFAGVLEPGRGEVEFTFDGQVLTGPTGPPNHSANEGFWVDSFLVGVALGRSEQLHPHLAYPTNRLRESPGDGDSFRYAMVDALKAFWTGNDTWKQLSQQALAESEPDRLTVMSPRMTAPLRAVLEALTPIAEGDQAGFTAALVATLKAHKAYYGRGKPSRGCTSLISIPACGVAALGLRSGLRVDVESGYMPTWLVAGI